jgi:hypothetical protein
MGCIPKIDIKLAVLGIVTLLVAGFIFWDSHPAPASLPPAAEYNSSALPVFPAVLFSLSALPNSAPESYETVSWYKSKHWWKRNAPIIGGAGGGALIGGLAGGGTGALIGGAVGGGGGYLYKRHREHHHQYHH